MSNEDFPALPGPGPNTAPAVAASPSPASDGVGVLGGPQVPPQVGGPSLAPDMLAVGSRQSNEVPPQQPQQQQQQQPRRGIQTSASGVCKIKMSYSVAILNMPIICTF